MSNLLLVQADPRGAAQLQATIQASSHLHVVACVDTLAQAQQVLASQTSIHLVVSDLWLKDASSQAIVHTLASGAHRPRAPRLLVIGLSGDDPRLFDALAMGVDGYFALARHSQGLVEAIEEVLRGEASMSPAMARQVKDFFEHRDFEDSDFVSESQNPLRLSAVERLILQWLGEGFLPSEVARGLDLSPRRVGTGIRSIFHKLQFHVQAERLTLRAA